MEWLAEGLMVTVLGLCTVFAVLIFICVILYLFGKVAASSKTEISTEKSVANIVPKVQPKAVEEVKVNDDAELIAVITAAIAASECSKGNNIGPDKLVVRRLKRVSSWNKEAINEQQNSSIL